MANSSIAITAGAGTNVDTRTTTTDGDHRQVVVIGDPATDAGIAPVDVTLGVATNLKGANGTALDTNSGLKSAGTIRVVLATDQPALTNKILVTPDSVALPSNQSVNVSQVNGVATSMGNGATDTGTQRVTISNDSTGKIIAVGDVASGSTDSGNPVKLGGVGRTTNPTAVTDGQRVNGIFDKLGKQIVVGAIRDLKGVQQTTITSSIAETTVVTAVVSTFLDLYGCVVTNTSATATKVTFKDSTAGTTRFVIQVPATETRGFMLPVDSAIPQATVNTNWTATCGTSVASVEISMLYVKNI